MGFVFGGMALMSILAIPVAIIVFAWLSIKEKLATRRRKYEPTMFDSWTHEDWMAIARAQNSGVNLWK